MSLSNHVRTLGRGPGRSRSLTQSESYDAMREMLSGTASPEAIGALLMLLRMKGETAPEIAGLALGAQAALPPLPRVDLDWPSYAAGRTRGLPWFLLSARLVAQAGHRVLIHGWNGTDGAVRGGLAAAGIRQADGPQEVASVLDRDGIAYLPLETLMPPLFDLLSLRAVLGLRSCINTVCRMLNPGRASASVQGVFHPSYRLLQADAAALMGWHGLSVIKGGGGEFERHPAKSATAFGLRGGAAWDETLPAQRSETRQLDDGSRDPAALSALWNAADTDPFAQAIVISTAALALDTLGHTDCEQDAQRLWLDRGTLIAA